VARLVAIPTMRLVARATARWTLGLSDGS